MGTLQQIVSSAQTAILYHCTDELKSAPRANRAFGTFESSFLPSLHSVVLPLFERCRQQY